MRDALLTAGQVLDYPIFTAGRAPFTVGHLLGALVAVFALLLATRRLRNWMRRRLLGYGHIDVSTADTISSLTNYVILTFGLLTILNEVGLKLSSFAVLAGSFGVGVGFGLQNIFSNFISGLILMFERPVKIGDHVVLAAMEGDVVRIGMRATTLRAPQGSFVIVPNQTIITSNVINWGENSHSAVVLQYRMLGSAEDNEALLLSLAKGNPKILQDPEPSVFTTVVDHAGQVVEVHFVLAGDQTERLRVVSAFNKALLAALAAKGQALAPNP